MKNVKARGKYKWSIKKINIFGKTITLLIWSDAPSLSYLYILCGWSETLESKFKLLFFSICE